MKSMLPTLVAMLVFGPVPLRAGEKVDFNYDIRPIISAKCFQCHGPDEKARKAKLRLDLPEDAYKKRGLTFAIKPGDLKGSNSWERIVSDEADYVMPPPAHKKQLTAAQKDIIKKWIEQGARYKKDPPPKPRSLGIIRT